MNQSEAVDELTEHLNHDAGLRFAADVGGVADLAGVESGVGRLHVADADGDVSAGAVGGGQGEAPLVLRGDHVLIRLGVVDLEAAPAARHIHTVLWMLPVCLVVVMLFYSTRFYSTFVLAIESGII